jgi:hypothetical protein
MVKDMEDAGDQEARGDPEPATRPPRGWLRRKVDEIARSEGLKLSRKAKKKTICELKRAILKKQENLPKIDKSWTDSFVSVACGWFISVSFS